MTATATKTEARIEFRLDGAVRYRTVDLEELRRIASVCKGGDGTYSVFTPLGLIYWSAGRIYYDDPKWAGSGASRTLWVNGELTDLVEIADQMVAGTPFEQV